MFEFSNLQKPRNNYSLLDCLGKVSGSYILSRIHESQLAFFEPSMLGMCVLLVR